VGAREDFLGLRECRMRDFALVDYRDTLADGVEPLPCCGWLGGLFVHALWLG